MKNRHVHFPFIYAGPICDSIAAMNNEAVNAVQVSLPRTDPDALSWWQRLVQPSIIRRLVLAQMVLLLQLWGSAMWWVRSSAGTPSASPVPDVWHGGLVMVPLVISAMLLVIPAWLSMRVALRPWRRVNDEIAARGSQDLAPLSFEPKEQELRPLVRTVNGLLGRVRDGMARERRFIADAAHELRTPLAAMRVNAEALRERVTDPGTLELLDGMVQSGDRAARLVAQLLVLMRADAPGNALPSRLLRLDGLVQESLAALAPLARQRGLELHLDAPESVEMLGEPEALASMIDNLVENAMKYSPDHGEVVVSVSRVGDRAQLTVADRGEGIPAQLHARVFERFYRVAGQSQVGSGLGLSIVKAAVERHQGTVSLSGVQDGPGLMVHVVLPVASEIYLRNETWLPTQPQPQ